MSDVNRIIDDIELLLISIAARRRRQNWLVPLCVFGFVATALIILYATTL